MSPDSSDGITGGLEAATPRRTVLKGAGSLALGSFEPGRPLVCNEEEWVRPREANTHPGDVFEAEEVRQSKPRGYHQSRGEVH